MMELSKISARGQVTIPMNIREKLGLKEGEKVLFLEKEDGTIIIANPNRVSVFSCQNIENKKK